MIRKVDLPTMKKAVRRTNARVLETLVILFQISAMTLLAFRSNPIDQQALMLAVIMPVTTVFIGKALPKFWKIDRVVLTMALFLCSVSIVTLTAIARSSVTPLNQAIFIGAGLCVMTAGIIFIRALKCWRRWTIPLMGVSLILIALPFFIGDWKYGAKNWIEIGSGDNALLSIQPSEFVKITLLIVLASCLSVRQSRIQVAMAVVFGAALCLILLLEHDLGALVLYFLTTIILYFLATSNMLITVAGLGAGAAGAVGAYYLFDYVRQRVAIWQNPWIDPEDKGYQIVQALIAIGSGGWSGMGLGLGHPRNIPLYHSDFIYAAICEEFGFVFAILLLAVYVIIIMKGISIAMSARNRFHSLLAFGIVTMMGLQTLLIVGGNTRLIPLTGVVLPLVASGGSSMVSSMGAIGLLLGISSINADADMEDIQRAEWQEGNLI